MEFAKTLEKENEILYKELCGIISKNDFCLNLADNVPKGQPYPNVFFAGVQFLLLKGSDSQLKNYFPSLANNSTFIRPDQILERHFLEFVEKNKDELAQICKTRKVQTNEIGRCALLLPGLNYVTLITPKKLKLIEIGTSAGLLLNYDQYSYKYSHLPNVIGLRSSKILIECEVRGFMYPPVTSIPKIDKKIGIDLQVLRCQNEDDSIWLQSLIWPYDIKRQQELISALEICRTETTMNQLMQGDGFTDISVFLDQFNDKNYAICLFHSFAFNQITADSREKYYSDIATWSKKEKTTVFELSMHWLSNSYPKYSLKIFKEGEITTQELAKIHQHGKWIEWLVNKN